MLGSLQSAPTIITPTISTYAALAISDNGNPYAQLALGTAHEAREHIIFSYTIIGCLSIFVWDALCHLRDDYHILSRNRIAFPTLVYFSSRLFTLLYLTGNTVIQMMPAGHCNVAIHVVTSPLVVAVPASQLLLYLHVRAIYATDRVVVWFFSLMWILTLVSVVISTSNIYGINLGPTNYCTPHTDTHTALGIISILVNDTLLFIALVARIMGTSTQDAHTSAWPLKDRFKTALLGASIPRLAKTLLQKGQQYILVTVIANLAALLMFYADGGNLSLGFANIMLINLMASRLYRSTKLSRYDELNVSFELSLPPSGPILFVRRPSRTEEPTALGSVSGTMVGTARSMEESYNFDNGRP